MRVIKRRVFPESFKREAVDQELGLHETVLGRLAEALDVHPSALLAEASGPSG